MKDTTAIREEYEDAIMRLDAEKSKLRRAIKDGSEMAHSRLPNIVLRVVDAALDVGEITRDVFVALETRLDANDAMQIVTNGIDSFEIACHAALELIEFIEQLPEEEVPQSVADSAEMLRTYAASALVEIDEAFEASDSEDEDEDEGEGENESDEESE